MNSVRIRIIDKKKENERKEKKIMIWFVVSFFYIETLRESDYHTCIPWKTREIYDEQWVRVRKK